MIFFLILLVLAFFAQVIELFIPPLEWMYNAHILIVPVVVFYGAMALPFPLMLALAGFAGLLLDALTMQVIDDKVEIAFGTSIIIYAVLASIMHGLRPLFIRGPVGNSLHHERRLHVADSAFPIPDDHFPARLDVFTPSVVADRRPGCSR
jgi:hypothetical protein